ncbi:SRPBCC domain-containing protein [Candidatus Woesearchaeota archaeon]|nr:SRPBCC domain-containing protein [Candidatus Woesearchaeota archaeon]
MKTITQTVVFKATPHAVYEALIDEKKHADFTGSDATISREAGGNFEAYDGWITGKNIMLVQDKKIVQQWKANDDDWPEGHDTTVTFELKRVKQGTQLTLTQEDVPEDWYDSLEQGWHDYYWKPLKKYLEK